MYDIVAINDIDYQICCSLAYDRKYPNNDDFLGVQLGLTIKRLSDNHFMEWDELKNSYIAEKISNYIKNTINGQRTFYYKYDSEVTE